MSFDSEDYLSLLTRWRVVADPNPTLHDFFLWFAHEHQLLAKAVNMNLRTEAFKYAYYGSMKAICTLSLNVDMPNIVLLLRQIVDEVDLPHHSERDGACIEDIQS